MKIKSLIILMIGAAVIGMSTVAVSADEITRTNEVPNVDVSVEEQNSEEPNLIAPNPYDDQLADEDEIIPLLDRGKPVPSEVTGDDGSEMSLISPAASKSSDDTTHSNVPVIFILGIVGFLVILLLIINRKK